MESIAKEYYLVKDYNCAESIIHIANEELSLGLSETEMRLLGGFGGGLGCEKTCGALCAGIAAISKATITERAHATEGFRELCADYVALFEQELGSSCCKELKEKYHTENERCLETVLRGADLLKRYLSQVKEQTCGQMGKEAIE